MAAAGRRGWPWPYPTMPSARCEPRHLDTLHDMPSYHVMSTLSMHVSHVTSFYMCQLRKPKNHKQIRKNRRQHGNQMGLLELVDLRCINNSSRPLLLRPHACFVPYANKTESCMAASLPPNNAPTRGARPAAAGDAEMD